MIVVAGTIGIKPNKRDEAVQVALRMSQATQAHERVSPTVAWLGDGGTNY